MMVAPREAAYVDQVPRRQAYEAEHPNVKITYLGPIWRAIIREDNGETVITRVHLRDLLDKLELMDEPGAEASPAG